METKVKSIVMLCLVIVIALLSFRTQAQEFNWVEVRKNGNPNYSSTSDIKTDQQGNVYTFGTFQGTLIMGNDSVTSAGLSYDLFFSKHTSSGQLLWLVSGGGAVVNEEASRIQLTSTGEVFFSGQSSGVFTATGSATFGSITVPVYGSNYFLIGKLDTNGNFSWINIGAPQPTANNSGATNIALDPINNVYVTGTFGQELVLGPVSLFGDHMEGFIGKYDSNGNQLWVIKTDSSWNMDILTSLVCKGNRVYIYGYETDTTLNNMRIVCLNANGNYLWQQTTKTTGISSFLITASIIQDTQGNLISNGYFNGQLSFGTDTISSLGWQHNGFIIKLDSTGSPIWLKKSAIISSANGLVHSMNIAPTLTGGFFEAGSLAGQVAFGNTLLPFSNNIAAYFDERDANGQVVNVFRMKGSGKSYGDVVASGPNGEFYIGGSALGIFSLGSQSFDYFNHGNFYFGQVGNLLATPEETGNALDHLHNTFPNPTSSSLTFTYPLLQQYALLTLTDALGRTVFQQTLPQGSTRHTADLSQLPEAVYFYQLATESGSIGSGKVVVVR